MLHAHDSQPTPSPRRVMLVMMSLSTLYNYLYSMAVSSVHTLGGALNTG